MSRLFQRRCVLYVDGLKVEGLRTAFRVVKSVKQEPNTADISVTNLNESHRTAMASKAAVILQAGYEDATRQIFSGDSRTIDHTRPGPDYVTRIQCGDGERAYQHARASESFAPGTKVSAVIRKLASVLEGRGIKTASALNAVAALPDQFTAGYTAHGPVRNDLDQILTARGYEWSVQDGELRIFRVDAPDASAVIVLTPKTGLVGSPEHGAPEKKGQPSILKARCLLNGSIRPGGRVRIQATGISGDFRVQRVAHIGDTHAGDWYTEIEGLPLGR